MNGFFTTYTSAITLCVLTAITLLLPSCAMYHIAPLDEGAESSGDGLLLTNSQWQLVQIQSMDDSVYTPDDPGKYILSFQPEGQLGVKADCNSGGGRWTLTRQQQIQFTQLISTLAMCRAESLSNRLMKDLNYVRSYVVRDGHLFLATMADGSILEFEPLATNSDTQNLPAYDCTKAESTVESLICNSPELTADDLHIDQLYQAALATFPPEEIDTLNAFQRGWITGRNDCWKDPHPEGCIQNSYDRRITELQIRTGYFIAPEVTHFQCGDNKKLTVYFYNQTRIPTAVVNTDNQQFFTHKIATNDNIEYLGRNETLTLDGKQAQWKTLDNSISCSQQ